MPSRRSPRWRRERRVTRLIVWTTAIEFAVFLSAVWPYF
jgi:hypothetical protein